MKHDNQKKSVIILPNAEQRYVKQPTDEVVGSVVEELEAMIVERGKQAREYGIKMFWEAGEMLRDAEKRYRVNISALVGRVARDNRITERHMGERNLWMAIKIFDTYPVFEKIYSTEHGENISLTKLKKELSVPRPKKEPTVDEIAIKLYEHLGPEKTSKLIKALQSLLNPRS